MAYQEECFDEMDSPWQAWALTALIVCFSVWSSAEIKGGALNLALRQSTYESEQVDRLKFLAKEPATAK